MIQNAGFLFRVPFEIVTPGDTCDAVDYKYMCRIQHKVVDYTTGVFDFAYTRAPHHRARLAPRAVKKSGMVRSNLKTTGEHNKRPGAFE